MKFIRNSLTIAGLFILLGCSKAPIPTILPQGYSFLMVDGRISKLVQRNDTLYQYESFVDSPFSARPISNYIILSVDSASDFIVVKIKMPEIADKGEKGYSLMALKNINNKHLGYSQPLFNLSRHELDSIDVASLPLEDMAYLTYFSDTFLSELSALKRVTTMDAVKEIVDAILHNNFKSGKISYTAEELNMACIEKGYNPVGAGKIIDSLLKARATNNELSGNLLKNKR
jgi:hypothetical protein